MARIDTELWREIAGGGEAALDERIQQAVRGLLSQRETLEKARGQATDAVAEIDRQLARVKRVLRAAGHDAEPKKKKKQAATTTSAESRERVLTYLRERPDQALTINEVAKGVDLAESTVRTVMAALRSEELVRRAGQRAADGDHGRAPTEYRLMARVEA